MLRNETLKADAVFRAADRLLAHGLVAWLATQDGPTRAAMFVAIGSTLSASDSRKSALHPQRPEIDPTRIDTARAEIAAARDADRAEKQRSAEMAKPQGEEALRLRKQAREDAKLAQYEALRAKFEAKTAAPTRSERAAE